MSSQDDCRGWTIVALKEYTDQRFRETDRAINKAESALEIRLEGMNEFRDQIQTERASLLSKAEYEARHLAFEVRLTTLERYQARFVGALALVIFVTPLVTALAAWYITHH